MVHDSLNMLISLGYVDLEVVESKERGGGSGYVSLKILG